MKTFVTLFPDAKNFHLPKDVGMIPYVMDMECGYDAKLATFNNDCYIYLDHEMSGLSVDLIKRRCGVKTLDSLLYIMENAVRIDILHLFHWGRATYLRMCLYKLINRQGKVYVKLDISDKGYNILKKNRRASWVFTKILHKADLVTVESTILQTKINALFHSKIEYLPNGFFHFSDNKINNSQKKNIILTVGRLGTAQKNTKNLVKGFGKFCSVHDGWKLQLVGTVEDGFMEWLNTYLESNPYLQDKILIAGEVADKGLLAEFYSNAKIFALPSRWESFGLVLVEALSYGCSLLTTKHVVSAGDIVNENGIIIDGTDAESIALGFGLLVQRHDFSQAEVEQNMKDAYAQFDWRSLAHQLDQLIGGADE